VAGSLAGAEGAQEVAAEMSTRKTPAERLARLTEMALKEAERKARAGEAGPVADLNGIRRLLDRQAMEAELEELNELTRG
jgi:hypothetical protein